MSEELKEEETSIKAIYGDDILENISNEPNIYTIKFPSYSAISLRIEFPQKYPDEPPVILGTQTVSAAAAKGEGTFMVDLVRGVLSNVHTPGAPCIFDLVEEVDSQLQQLGFTNEISSLDDSTAEIQSSTFERPATDELGQEIAVHSEIPANEPPWTLSEVITEKKSVFVARCAPVTSVDQAKQYLASLLASDKKVAKATHNITAWRIQGEGGIQYQDCDDDGETAAGARVLHLLDLMKVWNAMVVVTRWYGGIHLGPDRFRIINQTARDALVKGGFAHEAEKNDEKKKKTKR